MGKATWNTYFDRNVEGISAPVNSLIKRNQREMKVRSENRRENDSRTICPGCTVLGTQPDHTSLLSGPFAE